MRISDWSSDVCSTDLLAPGERLPSSRSLAADLGLGRNTVTAACDRLVAEGYLEGRRGAGLFVAADLPADGVSGLPARAAGPASQPRVKVESPPPPLPLTPGVPALGDFPLEARSEEHTSELQSLMRISYA